MGQRLTFRVPSPPAACVICEIVRPLCRVLTRAGLFSPLGAPFIRTTRPTCSPCPALHMHPAPQYARVARERMHGVTIVSSDKDMLQCVEGRDLVVYDPVRRVIVDAAGVEARFGVGPAQMAAFQALAGDAVDSVPGVPGIGPVAASELMEQFGSVHELLANLDDVASASRRDRLRSHAATLPMMLRLVELEKRVPLEMVRVFACPGSCMSC